jgi:hypothetical protein
MALHQLQDPRWVQVAWHHDRAAQEQDRQHIDPGPSDSEERRDRHGDVVAAEVGAAEEVDDVPGQVAVSEHDPLGRPGGARGMRQQADILHAHQHLDRVLGSLGHQRLEVQRPVDRPSDGDPVPDRVRRRGGVGRGVLDQHPRLDVVKDGADPIGCQPVVHRCQRRTQQPRGEQRLQERRVVGSQPRHPVTAPNAKPLQAVGQAPNPPGQLRIGERAVLAHQRHLVGGDPGSALDPGANPKVGPRRWHHGHGQGYPQPAPRRQEVPAADPERR